MSDEIESAWRVLNRRRFERTSSYTVSAPEAIERLSTVIVEAHKVVGRPLKRPPSVHFEQVSGEWRVRIEPPLKLQNDEELVWQPQHTVELALQSSFQLVALYIRDAMGAHLKEADELEARLLDLRDKARKLDLIHQSMGCFWPAQPLLPFPDPPSSSGFDRGDLYPHPPDEEDDDIPF